MCEAGSGHPGRVKCGKLWRVTLSGMGKSAISGGTGSRGGGGAAVSAGASPRPGLAQRWLARLSFVFAGLGAAILVAFAELKSIAILGVGLAAAVVALTAAFFFLSQRGVWRWLALAVFVCTPLAVIAIFAFARLLWVAVAAAAAWLLASATARSALAWGWKERKDWRMPERPAAPPASHPYLIMNPKSGGGKVGKFDLRQKAEELGAEVFLMSGSEPVDVGDVARKAVAGGADLLGVAGGDGTQALVAGIAAGHGIPFVVITAGTRNHFALDLGLDRENPAACLDALSDAVELRVDLGMIGDRTFVNNASFGAYAEIVETPSYRDDKLATTLDLLPDLLQGHRGARLTAVLAPGGQPPEDPPHEGAARPSIPPQVISAPQALLVANNPYGTGDIAGLSRRARLDSGMLGVVGITVSSARQAVGLLNGTRGPGLTVLTAQEVEITADVPRIPVGIDGEAVSMPVPVICAIRPGVLRVWVPRHRPGVIPPKPPMNWATLRSLAAFQGRRRG